MLRGKQGDLMRLLIVLAILCRLQGRDGGMPSSHGRRTVISAGTALDGRGRLMRDVRIVIENDRIVGVSSQPGPADYDLRGMTVMPGWIDAHVHITWSFGEDGKNINQGGTTPQAVYRAASNAWLTLMAGFTTVQSVGSSADIPLREAIAKGLLPGPRILTSGEPLMGQGEKTGTPAEIREYVRKQKSDGADLIKIFASGSIGSGMTLSQDQLMAACDEAKKQGLRTLVHAYREAVRAATIAGCTEVEHGLGATDDDLRMMAARGTFFDPQAGLLMETYIKYKDQFAGSPLFPKTPDSLATAAEAILAKNKDLMRRAARTSGLKIVFGTDSVAGAHGRNAEEFVQRVRDCGMNPTQAMISAQSMSAEALGMSDLIGSIATGYQADIIAVDGDPLTDITSVRRVMFVMKGGVVYKNVTK